MEASFRWTSLPLPPSGFCRRSSKNNIGFVSEISTRRSRKQPAAIAGADPAQVDLSWEIIVGALAGVTPFVIAGIEFSKRIAAQRRCGVCRGSGLVQRDKYYFRCPRCGGFLPWQSWKRFFQ